MGTKLKFFKNSKIVWDTLGGTVTLIRHHYYWGNENYEVTQLGRGQGPCIGLSDSILG